MLIPEKKLPEHSSTDIPEARHGKESRQIQIYNCSKYSNRDGKCQPHWHHYLWQ
jgi:hypothetical protein